MRLFFFFLIFLCFTNVRGQDTVFAIPDQNLEKFKLIDKNGKIVYDKDIALRFLGPFYKKDGYLIFSSGEKYLIYNNNYEIVKEYLESENTLNFIHNTDYFYFLLNAKSIELHKTYSDFKSYENKKNYYYASIDQENIYLLYKEKDDLCMDVMDLKEFKPKKSDIKINKLSNFSGRYLVCRDSDHLVTSVFDLKSYSNYNAENIKFILYRKEFDLYIIEYKNSPKIALALNSLGNIFDAEILDYYPFKLYGGFIFQKKDGWYRLSNNKLEKIDDNPVCRFKSEFFKLIVNEQKLIIDYYPINKKIELNRSDYSWNEIILSDENIYLDKSFSDYSDLLDKQGSFILKDVKISRLLDSSWNSEERVYQIKNKKNTSWEMNKNKKYFYRNKKQITFIEVK